MNHARQVMGSATRTAIDRFAPDYTARNDRHLTPLTLIRRLGRFDLDPCGAPGHPTAETVWTPEEIGDGLSLPWFGRVWLNPPYGRTMPEWVARLAAHGDGVALIPARVDTRLFHDHVFGVATAINFLRGRLAFGDGAAPAPFPCVLIAYGPANAGPISTITGHTITTEGNHAHEL